VSPDPNYVMTLSDDCGRSSRGGILVELAGRFHTCTVTNTYVGAFNAGGRANAAVKVITVMDNTNAPPALRKQPGDFTLAVNTGLPELTRFAGSNSGTVVGLSVRSDASDGLLYDVHVVNPDPHYVTTYS